MLIHNLNDFWSYSSVWCFCLILAISFIIYFTVWCGQSSISPQPDSLRIAQFFTVTDDVHDWRVKFNFQWQLRLLACLTSNQLGHEWCIMGWTLKHNCSVFWVVQIGVNGGDTLTDSSSHHKKNMNTQKSGSPAVHTHQWAIMNETSWNTDGHLRQNNQTLSANIIITKMISAYNME